MEKFRAFHSINNITNQKFMDSVLSAECMEKEWVVLEKIHGSNFSIFCNGKTIKVARRNAFLIGDEVEKFFRADKIIEKYAPAVSRVYSHLTTLGGGDKEDHLLVIRGEIFGGLYFEMPTKSKHVQKEVKYNPEVDFIAFDLSWDGVYLNWDTIELIFKICDVPYTRPLFRGSFEEAKKWSAENRELETPLPVEMFGLVPHVGNIREGHVLRPIDPEYSSDKSFIAFKDKSCKFTEVSKEKKEAKDPRTLSDDICLLSEEIFCYLTPSRLENVLSKLLLNERSIKNLQKIAGLLTNDAIADFRKENVLECDTAQLKKLKKIVFSKAAQLCSLMLEEEEKGGPNLDAARDLNGCKGTWLN